jgi:hypothetical protein
VVRAIITDKNLASVISTSEMIIEQKENTLFSVDLVAMIANSLRIYLDSIDLTQKNQLETEGVFIIIYKLRETIKYREIFWSRLADKTGFYDLKASFMRTEKLHTELIQAEEELKMLKKQRKGKNASSTRIEQNWLSKKAKISSDLTYEIKRFLNLLTTFESKVKSDITYLTLEAQLMRTKVNTYFGYSSIE